MPQSGTLNPPKTLLQISWLCFTTGHILCCEENKKKMISPSRQKLMSRTQETFKLFLSISVFSNCSFLGLQLYHENNGI